MAVPPTRKSCLCPSCTPHDPSLAGTPEFSFHISLHRGETEAQRTEGLIRGHTGSCQPVLLLPGVGAGRQVQQRRPVPPGSPSAHGLSSPSPSRSHRVLPRSGPPGGGQDAVLWVWEPRDVGRRQGPREQPSSELAEPPRKVLPDHAHPQDGRFPWRPAYLLPRSTTGPLHLHSPADSHACPLCAVSGSKLPFPGRSQSACGAGGGAQTSCRTPDPGPGTGGGCRALGRPRAVPSSCLHWPPCFREMQRPRPPPAVPPVSPRTPLTSPPHLLLQQPQPPNPAHGPQGSILVARTH